MLDKLLDEGKTYQGKFSIEDFGGNSIGTENENEYRQWIAKVGVYSERKLKNNYPKMTEEIIKIVSEKKTYESDYNLIIGYMESIKELGE